MGFKVGDRVEVIEMDDLDDKRGIFIGATATVTEVFETAVMVRFDDSNLRGNFNYIYNNQLAKINDSFKLYELFEIYANPKNRDRVFEVYDFFEPIVVYDNGIRIGEDDINDCYHSLCMYKLEVREIQMEHLTREELLERGVIVID